MPSILHSETHSNSVLFWSFKFILKIILLLYFALQTFISLLRKSYENLTQVFSPVSWQIDHALFIHSFIHSFIYSSTAGVELRTNYHADLTSPIKVSSNTSSCRWKQPRTYPPPTSGPVHFLFPLLGVCFLQTSPASLPHCIPGSAKRHFFKEPFLPSPSKKKIFSSSTPPDCCDPVLSS